ncbi:hypothetical protein ACFVAQ_20210 [Streptomyces sp. NPDC057651]|uniref:hypothetical protein n=1 Tax=Streptomyces sp. NPDC057651 TaxID=3346194 RepID=UPI0036BCEFA0
MTGNPLLAARMERAGLKQAELADSVNRRIGTRTGKLGTTTDRHVRNWLTGKTRWPQVRQRLALEEEFSATAQELGFIPPAPRTRAPSEDPVRRRTFTNGAASLTAGALIPAPSSGTNRVGMIDADRLERNFSDLVRQDNQDGAGLRMETRALAHARHALELQDVGRASARVRARLYYLAAAFTGTALWAAVEAQETDRAKLHLNEAMTLAGMAGSSEMQMRLWGHAALLSFQQQHLPKAQAAAEAGRRAYVCRQDALFRSLASARLAGILSAVDGCNSHAQRALANAHKAYQQADLSEERPTWLSFFDKAELNGLSALVMARLGRYDESEAYLHQALTQLRPEYRRNRTYYSVHLALAQLAQGEVEEAVATAKPLVPTRGEPPLSGRTSGLLRKFDRGLHRLAPGNPSAVEWADRYAEGELEQ